MVERAFGIDISSNQGLIDFDRFTDGPEEVCFAAVRAGISWGYTDKFFARNWHELKIRRVPRTAYHVLYPTENAVRQMDHFSRILSDDMGEFNLVLDVELDHGQTKATITARVIECARIIERRTGLLPLLYSRTEWLNRFTYPRELAFMPYWPAQYLNIRQGESYAREHQGPPALPPGFKTWMIHQVGGKCSPLGFGIPKPPDASAYLDYNRLNGTVEQFREWAGLAPVEVGQNSQPALCPACGYVLEG
jgi:GH25 family lysozyme M1 (1,4-beta-N-acetylmuramidase)